MPNYNYRCEECEGEWDQLVSLNADNPPCPACESKRVEKLLSRRFVLRTDSTYSKGRKTILEQCGGSQKEANRMVATLRKQGYNPSANDFYEPGLADFKWDAKAMIPQDSPRSTMTKRCIERGVAPIDGPAGLNIKVKPKEIDRSGKRLAPHIVESLRMQRLVKEPSLLNQDQKELRKQIVEDHGTELG